MFVLLIIYKLLIYFSLIDYHWGVCTSSFGFPIILFNFYTDFLIMSGESLRMYIVNSLMKLSFSNMYSSFIVIPSSWFVKYLFILYKNACFLSSIYSGDISHKFLINFSKLKYEIFRLRSWKVLTIAHILSFNRLFVHNEKQHTNYLKSKYWQFACCWELILELELPI